METTLSIITLIGVIATTILGFYLMYTGTGKILTPTGSTDTLLKLDSIDGSVRIIAAMALSISNFLIIHSLGA